MPNETASTTPSASPLESTESRAPAGPRAPDPKNLQAGRLRVALFTVFLTFAFLYGLVAIEVGGRPVSVRIETALREALGDPARPALVLVFALALGILYKAVKIPLSYLYEVLLERRFGREAPSAATWLSRGLREAATSALFIAPFLVALDAIVRHRGDDWWREGFVVLTVLTSLVSRKAPVFLIPFVTRYDKVMDDPALVARIEGQCSRAGIRFAGLYEFEPTRRTRKIRISFTGFGPTKRVVLAEGLRRQFPPDEIEAGFATEAAHYRLRHFWKGQAIAAATNLAGVYLLARAYAATYPRFGFAVPSDLGAFPLLALGLLLYTLLTFPLLAGVSRRFEYAADRYAAKRLTSPGALQAYLRRLARLTLADTDPHPWIEFLLYPYPALGRRLAALDRLEGPRAGLH